MGWENTHWTEMTDKDKNEAIRWFTKIMNEANEKTVNYGDGETGAGEDGNRGMLYVGELEEDGSIVDYNAGNCELVRMVEAAATVLDYTGGVQNVTPEMLGAFIVRVFDRGDERKIARAAHCWGKRVEESHDR